MAKIIRQREMSAGGVLGAALLVSILARSDLSASDRAWISSRIAAMREEDGSEDADLVQPVNRQVNFTFTGIDQPFFVGQSATLTVSASNSAGRALPVVCDLPGSRTTRAKGATILEWEPHEPGPRFVTCKAGAHEERRLVRATMGGVSPLKSSTP